MYQGIKFIITALSISLFVGCGYKPSSHMIQNIFYDNVYVEVVVDRVEPENAPFVKDEMNKLVYKRFKGHVVSKDAAQSEIKISYSGSTFTPIAFKDGYITRYQAVIRATFYLVTKQGHVDKTITSIVEADIQATTLNSSFLRTEAIRKGLAKALDQFLAYASAKGALRTAP
ncbi:MAG: hypothetical protein RLZZ428_243 [Pseudomonadota bacterium]